MPTLYLPFAIWIWQMNENGHFKFKDMEKIDCLANMLKMNIMKMAFAWLKVYPPLIRH
jgi:hypothetical protein